MEHELKTWPEYFEPVQRGHKTVELRLNDRNYQVGDTLLLREWEPMEQAYTGREHRVRVSHIVSGGEWLTPGYVAMSITPVFLPDIDNLPPLFGRRKWRSIED